ncbi:hypothetical protein GHT06_012154 [Daphnia sinensis]|uniref:Methyltransferase FkbM domain-containing protein n=1 Tax=Daphnia sinensis TaxID=1820382 RepID=A0AAD5LNQ4_9CRUS|nr:hypothetical protein GHT06_012154 [Daphnia sinensis]
MNSQKLPQDHPCVIETIRKHYLNKPSPSNITTKLDADDEKDRSPDQTGAIFRLLENKTDGFFVECGDLNGEYTSNSLDLERKYNWSGILIEANPVTFQKLLSRNRKAWTLPICLSLETYPTQITLQPKGDPDGHSNMEGEAETLENLGIPGVDPDSIKVQCFPFYSVLLAVGRTNVDFFSLDVEGHELKILKTIPWHKVNIKYPIPCVPLQSEFEACREGYTSEWVRQPFTFVIRNQPMMNPPVSVLFLNNGKALFCEACLSSFPICENQPTTQAIWIKRQ